MRRTMLALSLIVTTIFGLSTPVSASAATAERPVVATVVASTAQPTATKVTTSAQAKRYAKDLVYHWRTYAKWHTSSKVAKRQYGCLVNLWNKESGWRVRASNASGAYGIPQALPGRKMAANGRDWRTNGATQIRWGAHYIKGRYKTPCGAWSHWRHHNWY